MRLRRETTLRYAPTGQSDAKIPKKRLPDGINQRDVEERGVFVAGLISVVDFGATGEATTAPVSGMFSGFLVNDQ